MSVVVPDPAVTDWVPLWSLGGPGACWLIEDKVLAAAAASADFQNIPAIYKHLLLIASVRSDAAAVAATCSMRFNNDSGANYDVQYIGLPATSGAPSTGQLFAQTAATLGDIPAATARASRFSEQQILVADYANAAAEKSYLSQTGFPWATAQGFLADTRGAWRSTAAINRITVLPGTGNFPAGSRLTLYGLGDNVSGLAGAPYYGTSPPSSPIDGQEWILPADATNGVLWRFRYNAGSASAYKWEFVGGAPFMSQVAATQSTTSTSWADLATVGPSFTLPRGGDYIVTIGGGISGDSIIAVYMGFSIAGAAPVAPDYFYVVIAGNGYLQQAQHSVKKTGLGAVALVTKYWVNAGTGSYFNRWLQVTPIRVA